MVTLPQGVVNPFFMPEMLKEIHPEHVLNRGVVERILSELQSGMTLNYLHRDMIVKVIFIFSRVFLFLQPLQAAEWNKTTEDNVETERYKAEYFKGFSVVTASDMLARLPGISLAL
ncbi:MAG: hypothetical protein L3J50_11775 [Emcibacter sp.]|nr:hypothetical protein [Emcibacter sp.]